MTINDDASMDFKLATMQAFGTLTDAWIPAEKDGVPIDQEYQIVFRYRVNEAIDYLGAADKALAKDKGDKALKALSKGLEVNPYDLALLEKRAEVYELMGNTEMAQTDRDRLSELKKDLFAVNNIATDGSILVTN
jgi:tetratricopeptide (TPR) repeat protein